jgi:hypothetical protein
VAGDEVCFLVKKEVNLLPGVCGFFRSTAVCDELDSVRSGAGRVPGLRAMSSAITLLSTESFEARVDGGTGKSSCDMWGRLSCVVGLSASVLE